MSYDFEEGIPAKMNQQGGYKRRANWLRKRAESQAALEALCRETKRRNDELRKSARQLLREMEIDQ